MALSLSRNCSADAGLAETAPSYSIVMTTFPVRARAFQGNLLEEPLGFRRGRQREGSADDRLE